MNVAFHFSNGTSELVLVPVTPREERYLSLLLENRPTIKVKATTNSTLILEFSEVEQCNKS